MTVKEQYNKTLADTLIQNLKKRQIEGFYCATIEEAKAKALSFVAADAAVPKVQRAVLVINKAVVRVVAGIVFCTDNLAGIPVAMAIGDGKARTGCKDDTGVLILS